MCPVGMPWSAPRALSARSHCSVTRASRSCAGPQVPALGARIRPQGVTACDVGVRSAPGSSCHHSARLRAGYGA